MAGAAPHSARVYFVYRGSALGSLVSARRLGWCALALRLTALHRGRQGFSESERVGSILRKSPPPLRSLFSFPCRINFRLTGAVAAAGRGRGQALNSGLRGGSLCPANVETQFSQDKAGLGQSHVGACHSVFALQAAAGPQPSPLTSGKEPASSLQYQCSLGPRLNWCGPVRPCGREYGIPRRWRSRERGAG